ncbi:E3 ubiquitin-protein ligase mib1 [Phytophthora citrophthora]|uniref:E3 ubiquitin-protein ligase mib1 n=1 Tax=Phytophthora citrophthora TaxID=4793 RepID=A0AAD9FYD4_9STRA|nr:E3 ubiquitin-protein ligase mib1 [Phytophthora citrophthora]
MRDQTREKGGPMSMEQVHMAWLAAGSRGDAQTMKRLRMQHPQWLNLQRPTRSESAPGTVGPTRPQFCSWESFHLRTIGASALLTSAWDGCAEIVELLLETGQDPDTSDDGGLTAMMVAIMRYNIVAMRCVFRNGEAVRRNLVVDCREEEIHLLKRVLAVVELLVRFGADVNKRNQEGYSALHYAGNGDILDVAKYLVDAGADMDAQDVKGKTPLHHCICEENLVVANLLVSRGAQIDIADDQGLSPLILAIRRCNVNMLQIILNQYRLVVTDERRDFAADVLLIAVENEVEEIVRFIVEGEFSSVAVCNSVGETPLHRAIVKRNVQLMELLMRLDPVDANLRAATVEGDSVTHYAARFGSVREMELLISRFSFLFGDLESLEVDGNPFNATNRSGATCLYVVGTSRENLTRSESERNTITELLLQQGARLFRRDFILIRSGSGSTEQVVFREQVRRAIRLWVREASVRGNELAVDGNENIEVGAGSNAILLTELCVEWASAVVSPVVSLHRPDFVAVLHVVISAGYALDLLSLLLELSLCRGAMSVLLRRLERFSRFPRVHILLVQLHLEVAESLQL